MSFPYNPNLPNPPDNPSSDIAGMQTNAMTINNWTQVDHVGFNVATGGQHLQVTIPNPLSGDPTLSGAVGEIYTKVVSGLTQLFFANFNVSTIATQLTGLPQSSIANGYITLAGGLKIQWGTGNASQTGATQSFPIAFTNPPFALVLTRFGATIQARATSYSNLTNTNFTGIVDTTGSSAYSFIAIGI